MLRCFSSLSFLNRQSPLIIKRVKSDWAFAAVKMDDQTRLKEVIDTIACRLACEHGPYVVSGQGTLKEGDKDLC